VNLSRPLPVDQLDPNSNKTMQSCAVIRTRSQEQISSVTERTPLKASQSSTVSLASSHWSNRAEDGDETPKKLSKVSMAMMMAPSLSANGICNNDRIVNL
jgi:hypothetical protein